MLRGLQVTMDKSDPDSSVDHLRRPQIQQALNRWHSLNPVRCFYLHTAHYKICRKCNHARFG